MTNRQAQTKTRIAASLCRLLSIGTFVFILVFAVPVPSPAQNLRGGTQSDALHGGTQSDSLRGGTESTSLQGGTQSNLMQGGTEAAMIQGGVEHEAGPLNILIIVDSSYSMKEKISGEMKMEVAKKVLENAMARIPNDVNVGLRVFGQYGLEDPFQSCSASALLVPLGEGNRRSIIERVNQLKPAGLTPLTYALQCAAEDDFRGVQGKKVIILITDGMDTCGRDPCAYIARLPMYGIKIKCDVVGVDLKHDANARSILNCIANHSGGKYYDANTAAQLIDSISNSINQAISGRVIMPGNKAKNTETPPQLTPMQPIVPLPAPQR